MSLERALTVTEPAGALSEAFRAAGVATQGEVAGIVGESQGTWSRYHRGHSSPSARKLGEWVANAAVKGWTVRLVFADGGACTAEVSR